MIHDKDYEYTDRNLPDFCENCGKEVEIKFHNDEECNIHEWYYECKECNHSDCWSH